MTQTSILKTSKDFEVEKPTLDLEEISKKLEIYIDLKLPQNAPILANHINLTHVEKTLSIILNDTVVAATFTNNFYIGDKILEINDRGFLYAEADSINIVPKNSKVVKVLVSPIEEQKKLHYKLTGRKQTIKFEDIEKLSISSAEESKDTEKILHARSSQKIENFSPKISENPPKNDQFYKNLLINEKKFLIKKEDVKTAKAKDKFLTGLNTLMSTFEIFPENDFLEVNFEYFGGATGEDVCYKSCSRVTDVDRVAKGQGPKNGQKFYSISEPLYLDHLPYKLTNVEKTNLLKSQISNYMVISPSKDQIYSPKSYLFIYNGLCLLHQGDDEKLNTSFQLFNKYKENLPKIEESPLNSIAVKLIDTFGQTIAIYKNSNCLITLWDEEAVKSKISATDKSVIIQHQIKCLEKILEVADSTSGDSGLDEGLVGLLEVPGGGAGYNYGNNSWNRISRTALSGGSKSKNKNKPAKTLKIAIDTPDNLDIGKHKKSSASKKAITKLFSTKKPLDFTVFKTCLKTFSKINYSVVLD